MNTRVQDLICIVKAKASTWVVFGAAAYQSFGHSVHVASEHGASDPWLLPVSIDGLMIVAFGYVSHGKTRSARVLAWVVLLGAMLAVLGINFLAIMPTAGRPDRPGPVGPPGGRHDRDHSSHPPGAQGEDPGSSPDTCQEGDQRHASPQEGLTLYPYNADGPYGALSACPEATAYLGTPRPARSRKSLLSSVASAPLPW